MADSVAALRVSQLDAQELDEEVFSLTKSHLTNIFKYFKLCTLRFTKACITQTGLLGKYDPEVSALIKVVLWQFTLSAKGQTVGQQLLGIRYGQSKEVSADNRQWITGRQKAGLAVLYIACPWLGDRLSAILPFLGLSAWEEQIERYLSWIETGLKMASVINFMVFLRQGFHLSIMERLVGVRAQFPHRQSMRQVSFDFMTRELLWHGFSELLLFLLPLISVQRMKNTVVRWLAPRSHTSQLVQQSRADLMACVVCADWPIHPHHIGCRHVFCHYCITSNLKADPKYTCPTCGGGNPTGAGTITPQPVRPTVGPDSS